MRGISACLLGVACRYDGCALPPDVVVATASDDWVPFCPEQLGGLTTPRTPAEIVGGDGHGVLDGAARVIDADGRDVSAAFVRGAKETAALCERLGIREVVLKARSPSCGLGTLRRAGELIAGDGVTAALLKRRGIGVRCHRE